jgi:hypothetical protein
VYTAEQTVKTIGFPAARVSSLRAITGGTPAVLICADLVWLAF